MRGTPPDVSLAIAAGARQRSHSRVRVPWVSWPYFTVSDSRLPFWAPPTTLRATVDVFDPASTRDELLDWLTVLHIKCGHESRREHRSSVVVQLWLSDDMTYSIVACTAISTACAENTILLLFTCCCLVTVDCFGSTVHALSEYSKIWWSCLVSLRYALNVYWLETTKESYLIVNVYINLN
jgi:hypothetical protein